MPEYLSPGIYVEEIDAGPKPVEGVSTSTAGAVGVTLRGPTKPTVRDDRGLLTSKPELVTSFPEFVRKFGGYIPEPDQGLVNQWAFNRTEGGRWWQFPLAVKGFFDNGGQRLYVKRVFSRNADAAEAFFGKGVISEIVQDVAANSSTPNQVQVRHVFGIEVGVTVNIIINGIRAAGDFKVTGYSGTGLVILDKPVGQDLKGGRDFLQVKGLERSNVATAVPDPSLKAVAKSDGDWGGNDESIQVGTGLSVRIRPMVGATLKIIADPLTGGSPFSAKLTAIANKGTSTIEVNVAGLKPEDRVMIAAAEFTVKSVAALKITIDRQLPDKLPVATTVRRLRPANDKAAPSATINVWNASQLYKDALVELDNGTKKELRTVVSVVGNAVTLATKLTNPYYEEQRVRLIAAEVSVRYRDNFVIETEETFSNLRLADDKTASYFITNVNERSTLINLQAGEGFSFNSLADFPSVPPSTAPEPQKYWMDLIGGDDKLAELSVDDFVGVDGGSGKRTGIQALEDIDEISICMTPGIWASTVHSALIQHCEILKDRFAILDPQDGLSIEGIREFREVIDTKYAALYYPWVEVRDPSVKRNAYVAPSGHMAGIYARVDVERGVHKAPGNEVIRGITKISQDVTKREQDLLNPKGINALRFFPGRGNRVWGARTLSSDSSWKYINVRRLFIFVEESIDEGTQWVVFEPNDEPLWARVRQTITNFLTTVWHSGALQGTKPDEAFFVKCDRTTMTQEDIDNGRLICVIGIAPVKPAEFVIFRIQQKTQDTQTS
jgi:uncharacterized protein